MELLEISTVTWQVGGYVVIIVRILKNINCIIKHHYVIHEFYSRLQNIM